MMELVIRPWVLCFHVARKAYGFKVYITTFGGLWGVGCGKKKKDANLESLFGLTLGLDKQLFTLEK